MAEVLSLLDGSIEVVLDDPTETLRRIIYDRLGADCEQLFLGLFEDYKLEILDKMERAKEFEQNADGYFQMCQDALDAINECIQLVGAPGRLDKKSLRDKLQYAHDNLWHNL